MDEQRSLGLPPIDDEYQGPSWWHLSRLGDVPRSRGMRRIALLMVGVLAVAMVAQATFGRPEPVPPDFLADRAGYLRMGAVVLSLLATALLLERIGFALTMFAVYLFLLCALGKQRFVTSLLVALVGSFGVYFVFVRWLNVPLPNGVFGW